MLFQKAFNILFGNLNGCGDTWHLDAPAKWILGPVDDGEECKGDDNCKKDVSWCQKAPAAGANDLGTCKAKLGKDNSGGDDVKNWCFRDEYCLDGLVCNQDKDSPNYRKCEDKKS